MTRRVPCPGRFALCGIPCGCEGKNPTHHPRRDSFEVPPPIPVASLAAFPADFAD